MGSYAPLSGNHSRLGRSGAMVSLPWRRLRCHSFTDPTCPAFDPSVGAFLCAAGGPRRSGRCASGHDAADVTDREATSDGGGAVVAPHENRRRVVWSRFDAFCFGLGPFDLPVSSRKRSYGASLPLARSCHRSSQPGCGRSSGVVQISRLSADTSGGEQKSRPVQLRRRLTLVEAG